VFVGKEVKMDKAIVSIPEGARTQFILFPRSEDRTIVVMLNKRFVAAWRGFAED
jgi:hypothetical protein